MKNLTWMSLFMLNFLNPFSALAVELKINDEAPLFKGKTQSGAEFDLASRKGKWTVLFFYPKADTPGCTKQACAFRDSIDKLHAEGAEVYGISANTVEDQAAFHKKYHLKFDLIADAKSEVIKMYGTKMPVVSLSKRWTFIIDPDLKIRSIRKDVDPVMDAKKTAEEIAFLKTVKKN